MILIGGWGHPAAVLQPLAAALAGQADVTTLSITDLAPAYADKLIAILQKQPGPSIVLGWSMGGMIAIEAAARLPELVAGLILVDSTARFTSDENYPEGIPSQNLRAMSAALKKHPAVVLSQFFAELHAPAKIDSAALSAKVSDAIRLGVENLCLDLNYLQSSDLRMSARSLNVPAMVLHGREDRVIPWQAGQWLIDNLPQAGGVVFDGSGHDLPLDHPELVARAVIDFIELKTNLNDTTIRRRFSAAAGTYDAQAHVQNAVADKLIRLIPPEESVTHLLEVGCGTGALTRLLLGNFPNATIDAIDISPKMITAASRNFSDAPTIRWHVADARNFRGRGTYPLIASNCALHWVDPLLDGLHHLARLLMPGGQLTFSIMLDGTLHELHEARERAVPDKQSEGRLPRLAEVIDSLELSGCEVLESLEENEIETYPSAAAFLRSIHDMGLTGGAVSRASTPLTRRELNRLIADYDEHYHQDFGHVVATYEVGYIKAVKR